MSKEYTPSFLVPTSSTVAPGILSSAEWIRLMHPEDRSAIDAMEKLPGFSAIMKWVLSGVVEKMAYGKNIGNSLKLGPKQLPEYYDLLPPVCKTLGIENIPEFYMTMDPNPNAWTCGEDRVFICVTSGLMQSFKKEDIQIVLAHECGHILFKHVRYLMLAQALMMGLSSTLGKMVSIAALGGLTAFEQCVYRWMRMSEYSADRVALLYSGSISKGTRMIMRLAGGPEDLVKNINPDAYFEQSEECERVFSQKDFEGVLQNFSLWSQTHPLNASRVAQMRKFAQTTDFKAMARRLGTICCPTCGGTMRTNNICVNGHII